MPRRPRIKLTGIPQHLVQRGVNREPCFFAEEDYHCYLHWLQEAAADWRCALHAYVLMTNHVHLLLTPETAEGPAKLMQSIGRRYVQYINRHYKRSGTLWEGATNPAPCRPKPTFSPVAGTLNSTPYEPAWWKTPATIVGPVTVTTA